MDHENRAAAGSEAAAAWQWVPVRLDLHRGLIEDAEGGAVPADWIGEADRDRILGLIRSQSVPALYTAGEHSLQLMVPVRVEHDGAHVARADASGELTVGTDLDALMEHILEVPGLEYASWQTGSAPGDEPRAVALFRAPLSRLHVPMAQAGPGAVFETASAGSGWTLVRAADYEQLLALVDAVAVRAVVLDTDGEHRALTVVPGTDEVTDEPITLEWGPVRDAVGEYPQNSPAGRLQAEGTGSESAAHHEAARLAGVAALVGALGLDRVSATRLDRYSQDTNGRYATESVLQLLGWPDVAAKVLDGRKRLADQPDYAVVRPEGIPQAWASAGRAGARESSRQAVAAVRRNPWAVAAGAGAGLAAWLLRRRGR